MSSTSNAHAAGANPGQPPPLDEGLQALRFGVLGPGRLGASLARDIARVGLGLVGVGGGASGRAARLGQALGVPVLEAPALCQAADVLLVTAPDAALPQLARSLPARAGQLIVHCAGALGLDVLAPLAARGAVLGCLHPLQSFAHPEGEAGRLNGVTCGIEAAPPFDTLLAALCVRLGAQPLWLAGVDRAGYHAAAVFASNYLVALFAAAERAFVCAGLPADAARAALVPLSRGTLDNVAERPPAAALTGPLARGDASTLAAHVRALSADPELLSLYRALSRALLALPLPLDAQARTALERVLGE